MPARRNPFWVEDFLLLHLRAELMIDLLEERLLVRQVTRPIVS
jgi:hypothetical protein